MEMPSLSIAAAIGRRGRKSVPVSVPMALLLLLLLGTWLAWAPPARAGKWTQVTCTQPDGKPAPIEGWDPEAVSGPGNYSNAYSTCEDAGGALIAESSNQWPQSRYSGYLWHYVAPNGSTIAGGTLSLNLYSPEGQAYIATPANSYPSDVVMNCQFNLPCSENGLNGGPFVGTVPIDHLGGTNLYAEAECLGPGQPGEETESCPTDGGGNGVNAQTAIYAADIELENSSTPTGTDFAGALLSPSAASGIADLTFSAQDPDGPGVYRVIVELDGKQVYRGTPETNGGHCASIGADSNGVSEFLYAQPCKQDVAVDVPLETTGFANGSHALKVTVQDAAGNSAVVYDGTISIANPGSPTGTPIGPGSPLALRGAPNGANASDQAKLTARWIGTGKEVRTSRYGQPDRVTGRLTTTAGVPISGALLDVSEVPADQGAKAVQLARTSTGPTGAWTLTLPRGVCSSALRFAYRSHVDDTVPVATATLTLRVHAGIALKIAPRTSSVGRTIHFSGTLHGTPIPEEGKQLVLEARSGAGEWIQFNTIRTDATGRYRASYRFKFAGPITYQFRVLSRFESGFPFLAGSSNVVDVHER
jgi:hypothetical protein